MRIHHATAAKAKKFNITLTVEDNEVVATAKDGTRLASGLQGNKVLEDAITKSIGHVAKRAKTVVIPVAEALTLVSTEETETHIVQEWVITGQDQTEFKYTTRTEIGDTEFTGRGLDRTFKAVDGSATTARDIIGQAISGEIELTEDGETHDFNEHAEDEGEGDEIEAEGDENEGEDGGRSVVKSKYKKKYQPTRHRCGDELGDRVTAHVLREDDDGETRINLNALRKFAKANDVWVESYASLKNRTGTFNAGLARMNVLNRLRAKIRQAAKREEEFEVKWV